MIRRGRGGVSNNVAGNLSVSGNATVGGDLNVTADAFVRSVYASGEIVLTGDFSKFSQTHSGLPFQFNTGNGAAKILSLCNVSGTEFAYVSTAGAFVGSNIAVGATVAGVNTGDATLAAFGASPNANGASLVGQALTLQPANSSAPGGVSTSAQDFSGKKTFLSGAVNASNTFSPANAGSVTPSGNSGNTAFVSAGAGVAAFTVNAPTGPTTAQRLLFVITNASGGVLAVTWDATYHLATWASPLDGAIASIEFIYNGSAWLEINRSLTTVPA